jgi:hypothetical protein
MKRCGTWKKDKGRKIRKRKTICPLAAFENRDSATPRDPSTKSLSKGALQTPVIASTRERGRNILWVSAAHDAGPACHKDKQSAWNWIIDGARGRAKEHLFQRSRNRG